jgi:hypothetical protein
MNKQLTPFERAEHNRQQGMKRLAGIIITQKWIERMRQLRAQKQMMPPMEKVQWDTLILHATLQQKEHFGYDA